MNGSAQKGTTALIDNLQMIFYREARDFCKGFYANPRWFLMRKIARFDSVKAVVNWWRRHSLRHKGVRVAGDEKSEIFPLVDIDHVIDILRRDGLYLGFNLPAETVDEIVHFARGTLCYGNGNRHWGFYCDEKLGISQRFNLKLTTADYFNTASCEAIQRVIADPILQAIAGQYLGGNPVHQGTWLRWSYGVELSELEQYKYSRTFHYDLDDYKTVKFFFYLTDVDMQAGPHTCVVGSHRDKRWSHRLFRGRCTDADMADYYGVDKIVAICGQAGSGFVEDACCMHKGLSPVQQDRLILIVEYALHDYGMQHDDVDTSLLQELH